MNVFKHAKTTRQGGKNVAVCVDLTLVSIQGKEFFFFLKYRGGKKVVGSISDLGSLCVCSLHVLLVSTQLLSKFSSFTLTHVRLKMCVGVCDSVVMWPFD